MSLRKTLLAIVVGGVAIGVGIRFLPREQEANGPVIHGTLAHEELREIEGLLQQRTSDSVLSVRPAGRDRWEVWTGVVRGPLDGGGDIFVVEKHFGKWTVVEECLYGWVS